MVCHRFTLTWNFQMTGYESFLLLLVVFQVHKQVELYFEGLRLLCLAIIDIRVALLHSFSKRSVHLQNENSVFNTSKNKTVWFIQNIPNDTCTRIKTHENLSGRREICLVNGNGNPLIENREGLLVSDVKGLLGSVLYLCVCVVCLLS